MTRPPRDRGREGHSAVYWIGIVLIVAGPITMGAAALAENVSRGMAPLVEAFGRAVQSAMQAMPLPPILAAAGSQIVRIRVPGTYHLHAREPIDVSVTIKKLPDTLLDSVPHVLPLEVDGAYRLASFRATEPGSYVVVCEGETDPATDVFLMLDASDLSRWVTEVSLLEKQPGEDAQAWYGWVWGVLCSAVGVALVLVGGSRKMLDRSSETA